MPIYEYQCESCSKEFERFQKVSDAPLETCPDCHGKVKRIVSRTSFSLKGSGWYKDGYTSTKESAPKENSAEKKPAKQESPTPEKTKTKESSSS